MISANLLFGYQSPDSVSFSEASFDIMKYIETWLLTLGKIWVGLSTHLPWHGAIILYIRTYVDIVCPCRPSSVRGIILSLITSNRLRNKTRTFVVMLELVLFPCTFKHFHIRTIMKNLVWEKQLGTAIQEESIQFRGFRVHIFNKEKSERQKKEWKTGFNIIHRWKGQKFWQGVQGSSTTNNNRRSSSRNAVVVIVVVVVVIIREFFIILSLEKRTSRNSFFSSSFLSWGRAWVQTFIYLFILTFSFHRVIMKEEREEANGDQGKGFVSSLLSRSGAGTRLLALNPLHNQMMLVDHYRNKCPCKEWEKGIMRYYLKKKQGMGTLDASWDSRWFSSLKSSPSSVTEVVTRSMRNEGTKKLLSNKRRVPKGSRELAS